MKWTLLIVVLMVVTNSCYTSRVLNGNVIPVEPLMEVNAKKNHFLFWGLIPLSNPQRAADYIGDKKNYVVETSWTFVDCLINALTGGIYIPITTTYYLPFDEVKSR